MKSLRGGPFFAFSLPGGWRAPLPPRQLRHYPQSKSAAPPCHGLKQSQASFSGRNYFITMHHQARVNFENFTEVEFRDILLTGTRHRDSPGQTYGRSYLNLNLTSFVKNHLLFLLLTPPPRKVPPRGIALPPQPRLVGSLYPR